MAITRTPMIDDDGTGTTGTIINNAWKTELYNQIDGLGTWIDVPYSAANFAGTSGMTWTVQSSDVMTFSYTVIGRLVFVNFAMSGTDVGGSPGFAFRIATPFALPSQLTESVGFAQDNNVGTAMRIRMTPGDAGIYLYRVDATAWSLSTAGTYVAGHLCIFV